MKFNILLQQPEIRKIFGEKELLIIKKQELGIQLTQSEKNRLSRDIRTKFKAIALLSEHQEQFKLKKGTEKKRILEEIIKELRKEPQIQKALLFGSYANNTQTTTSDIDICLKLKEKNHHKAEKIRFELSGKLPEKVDIHIYNHLPEKIQKSIKKNNKILFTRK